MCCGGGQGARARALVIAAVWLVRMMRVLLMPLLKLLMMREGGLGGRRLR
jgi:hypothetical protein